MTEPTDPEFEEVLSKFYQDLKDSQVDMPPDMEPTDPEFEEVLSKFYQDLKDSQVDMPPDMAKILYENLWDLY